MKKWSILIIIFIIVIVSWQFASTYHQSVKGKQSDEEKAMVLADKKYQLKDVTNVQTYFGKDTFYIVKGTNNKGEKVIVWVPKDRKKHDMIMKKEASGITQAQARSLVENERNPQEIKSVRLGMERKLPLWEITYIDEENRFTYYYVDFESGKFLKRYSLSQ
ncbi:DUF5590 domain-containing protein [Metabacillus iocasae]|uniref:Uncharacterized protein YpmB n=1 Tax=Priestia iocasae TaxID=2291674 RepID=A0ABS2QV04_9BACI|nr:DUF5590 domain-containing protein [Metabacillus iocasae]MBM7703326.1 uncharacterized protein YpmB [Metabacillus iocasae]